MMCPKMVSCSNLLKGLTSAIVRILDIVTQWALFFSFSHNAVAKQTITMPAHIAKLQSPACVGILSLFIVVNILLLQTLKIRLP